MPVYGRSRLPARAREERSFEAMFKRYHAPLLSYCRHMLGDQDEAEDALQQAFIKAHQALLGGTTPRELRPWLYAIARNCCLSAIAARRPTAPLEDHTPALAGLSEEVHRREDLRELVAGIGRLPEDQRSALLLAELDDLSHQAIAAVVGCPVSKVKALIYQARSALIADRDALGASCEDIREQLAVAHGGELRRGPLRRHLKLCVGCRDFQLAVSAQRQSLAAVLPVLPSAGLAAAILGHGAAHAAGAAAGGTGVAASGTAATTAVSASAGGGTGIGTLVGGGLITKLAVGGTVVALAAAGAVTVHNRETHTTPHRTTRLQLAFAGAKGRRVSSSATDIADSSSLSPGSPSALIPVNGTAIAGAPGTEHSAELSGLLGTESLATVAGTRLPSLVLSGIPGQPASIPGQPTGKAGLSVSNSKRHANTRAKRRRATTTLHRRRLRRLRRAQLRRRRLAARRRARLRKALRHHRRLAAPKPPTPPKPPVTPAPVRVPHRKARTAPAPGPVSAPAGTTTTGSTPPEAGKPRHHKPTGTGTGTGTGKTGGSSGTGSTSSKTKAGSGEASGTSTTGSTTGAGATGKPSGPATGTSETTGAGTTTSPTTKAHQKKRLVEEEQLPNL